LNLDDHPLLLSAVDFGDRLQVRARQFGANIVSGGTVYSAPSVGMRTGVRSDVVGGVQGGVPGGVPGGVMGGMIASVPAAPPMPPPPTVRKVDPVYPPLARQARISGIVKLSLGIATDGSVKQMSVISGHPLLVPAALEAVRQWTFQAPPRELTTHIDVPFIMDGAIVPSGQFSGAFPLTPSRIKVGGNVQASKLVRKVDPVYPSQARAERIEGDVTVQITIDKTGQVTDATAVEGNPVLAKAAMEAVLQWAYQPTLLNGDPVEVVTTVSVPFRLE
jgi:TonB family protein